MTITIDRPRPVDGAVCACGQELDVCSREHCPRCGATLRHVA